MKIDFTEQLALIDQELTGYRGRGLRMFSTSSFQTNSVVLLHILSELAPEVPVYFLDTGYHFPETLAFREDLASRFGLEIRNLRSAFSRIEQRDPQGRLLFASDPDRCCELNKVLPLDPVLAAHDLWINGVRGSQSANRAAMGREASGRGDTLRYHPLMGWDARMVHYYIEQNELPRHPLEAQGYFSMGCMPCTRRPSAEGSDDRSGRWFGMNKTECGLHLGVESSG
jgi:phosphoadenosine phosphosulfate reductase